MSTISTSSTRSLGKSPAGGLEGHPDFGPSTVSDVGLAVGCATIYDWILKYLFSIILAITGIYRSLSLSQTQSPGIYRYTYVYIHIYVYIIYIYIYIYYTYIGNTY